MPRVAVTAEIAPAAAGRAPLVLVHGSATTAAVWQYWQPALAGLGWSSYALDLRGHGASGRDDRASAGLASADMAGYDADVLDVVGQMVRPPVVMGWSMGGLIAISVAATGRAAACVAIAPSTPVRHRDRDAALDRGVFGPEVYGLTPDAPADHEQWADLDDAERAAAIASQGPESLLARSDRKAGIEVPSMPCPLLVLTGGADTSWGRDKLADFWLPADYIEADGVTHYGLLFSRPAVAEQAPRVAAWLEATLEGPETSGGG